MFPNLKKVDYIFIGILIPVIIKSILLKDGFAGLYCSVPILFAYKILRSNLVLWEKPIIKINLILIGFLMILFPLSIYIMWITDYDDLKTGSSTSALILFFAPLYSILSGLIPIFFIFLYKMHLKKVSKIKVDNT